MGRTILSYRIATEIESQMEGVQAVAKEERQKGV